MIQVDGSGSFFVVRNSRITLGPVSSPRLPDVGLMADPNLPVATVERVDEDYFIKSDQPISINDKPTTSKLLCKDDRIALAQRCRIKFDLPNAASTSAVLDLSGARLVQGDVRRVILMDKQIIIAGGPAGHILLAGLSQPLVLHVREDCLFCQTKVPVLINNSRTDISAGIPINTHVRIGEVSFIVTEV